MNTIAVKLIQQVCVIFLLMGVGIFARKKKIIAPEGARQFTNLALVLITPTLLVNVFQRDFYREQLPAMGTAFLLIVVFHILSIAVTSVVIRRRGGDDHAAIERLGAVMSNCGYMGIPLMNAAIGEVGMLYAAIYIGVFNVVMWSYGVMTVQGTRKISFKQIITAPGTIGFIIGVSLFLLQIRLPLVLTDTMGYVASMNTPLPTIITGVFLADILFKEAVFNKRVYLSAAMRLLVLPLIFLGLLWVARVPQWYPGADVTVLAVMISCSCPAAVSTMMLPARFNGDTAYGGNVIAVSTLLSVVTIPFISMLTQMIL